MKRALAALAIAILAAAVSGCGSATAKKASAASQGSRCRRVSAVTIRQIETGIKPQYAGMTIRGVRAVRSRDYNHVFFASADLQDHALSGKDDIATWALGTISMRSPADANLIFSAENIASTFTDWGTMSNVSLTDDGLLQSQDCTRQALGG